MSQHALQTEAGVLMVLTRFQSVRESGVRNLPWAHTEHAHAHTYTRTMFSLSHTNTQSHIH